MSVDITNDNDVTPPVERFDGNGLAALLLVESLIHGLIEQSVITVEKAVEIVDVAADVNRDSGVESGNHPRSVQKSVTALQAISHSLRHDLSRNEQ